MCDILLINVIMASFLLFKFIINLLYGGKYNDLLRKSTQTVK